MNRFSKRAIAFSIGLAWAGLAGIATADDTELFVGSSAASQEKPNILLILDDSGSMSGAAVSQNNYDPLATYVGTCDVNRVYFSTSGNAPTCGTSNWFNKTALKCQRALDAFGRPKGGTYIDNMAQYDPGFQDRWETIDNTQKDRFIECQDDRPDPSIGWAGHGETTGSTLVYARNGNDSARWSSNPAQEIQWGTSPAGTIYTLFSGHYLNWYYSPGVLSTRIEVMEDVASNIVNSINGVNFGLMDFNRNTTTANGGGLVSHAVEDVTTGRATLLAAIDALFPDGNTPLSETLHEAYQYLRGSAVIYGTGSVAAARMAGNPTVYDSPLNLSCQKTHIVYLTDGEPTQDTQSDTLIPALVDAAGSSFATLTGGTTCDDEGWAGGGDCLDDLAEFMYDGDLSPLPGQQYVTTHTVGFLIDLPILEETARRGGGEYHTAIDTASLTEALSEIIRNILDTQTTFTAPAVSINSFNQTRNLDDLYFSVFRPTKTTHWAGNLKKYELRGADATIIDANGNAAIDTGTGFFSTGARSFWSTEVDGDDITAGGAANLIPLARNVYTYLGIEGDLTNGVNRVRSSNTDITDAILAIGNPGDPSRVKIFDFINGLDAPDLDDDGILNEARNQMGDPLHAQPVSVVYDPNTNPALDVTRLYFATNDGYLHSIDANTGVEQWAFLPEEFLGNQVDLYHDNQAAVGNKLYGIDGTLRVQAIVDSDGVVEWAAGERVYLFFGMRRGGDVYYALDVTRPDLPTVMWRLDSSDLPGSGQSWSSAMPARINVNTGAQTSAQKLVLVIGGGYDPTQDNYTTSTDTSGNSIYIVDSESGALLWHGSNAGATKNFALGGKAMEYSIPADIRVIDLNGDSFADRMYAADMGGQVWRFDIFNGEPPATLVNGGVIAKLGAAGLATPTLADTRRFYYAPDVALASTDDYSFIHVGIGSGYREHPNETDNQNRFYALRDYETFSPMMQAEYDALTPIVDGDLVDVTTSTSADVPQGSDGWRLFLNDGGWRGEKVISETRTFDNKVFVNTFIPSLAGTSCEPALGTVRQYIMSLFNGAPVNNRDGSPSTDPLSLRDRYVEYRGSPPPETTFIFPPCVGSNCPPVRCVDVRCELTDFPNLPVRTFWTQESIE